MLLIRRFCSSFQRISNIARTKEEVGIQGWVQTIRRLKNNIFLDVSDGSTSRKLQLVLPRNDKTKAIGIGSVIRAVGKVQVAPNGSEELCAESVEVIGDGYVDKNYPFSPKQSHPPEYVREYLHLRSRVDYVAAQMRLRHRALKSIHDYMDTAGFIQINTPILTTNDCEGAGEVFTVQPGSDQLLKEMSRPGVPLEDSYFDSKVYLSVSGQLHLEAMSYGLGNAYTLSPAFRAENSKSPLHLSEFYMFEAELAYIERMDELTAFIEKMLKDVTNRIVESSLEDLQFCQRKALGSEFGLPWLEKPWTRLSFNEALSIITGHKNTFKTKVKPDEGFSKEQELFLVAHCDSPVFVIDWPKKQKPFYMKVSRSDPELVYALDLLMPGVGELCGGSLRESDPKLLQQHPQFPKGLEWYLELRNFGGIPTGGFGMGLERYLQLISGFKNIRDVIPFPRYPHNCKM